MGRHHAEDDEPNTGGLPSDTHVSPASSRDKIIEWLLDTNSHQAKSQTEPGDVCTQTKGSCSDVEQILCDQNWNCIFWMMGQIPVPGFMPWTSLRKQGLYHSPY